MEFRFSIGLLCLILSFYINPVFGQVYPPETQLVFNQMPNVSKPGYLAPITDPVFGTTVVRISDQAVFNTHHNGLITNHHYSKTQAWNSDGTMIKLRGWPSAILDGNTYQFIKTVTPPGGHHTWSNTKPNIIYGSNNPNYDGNCIAQLDVNTNTRSLIACFNQYSKVSMGDYEGNMSNDDRYMAIQCDKTSGGVEVACYDFVTNNIVATINGGTTWPNNVTMSQSGNYIVVQWGVSGTGATQGIWAYDRTNVNNRQFISYRPGIHYDLGYDTQGNEVAVATFGSTRALQMIRLDNGVTTNLLSENQMAWPIHVSCRNTNRPGWVYISDFEASYGEPSKPNYQKIFAVKLDPAVNGNAVVQVFAQPHHSTNINYERSTFGTPNRDGSRVMFRSDWMGNASSEINSYVAFMPGNPTCNVSCTATQTTAPTCGNNNGSATATAQGGTAPYSYSWSDGQTSQTANNLPAGTYTVTISDANNCSTTCTVTLTNSNNGGGAFANVSTQNNVAWNAGNSNANRPKPALGVWEPGDVPGTEIMRVSDDSGNGLHFYNSRQVWNIDMTKVMVGDGVVTDNKLLDATNNYALLPTRIPLNSHRVWSNMNPNFIYGIRAQTQFCRFNVATGATTVLFSRGTVINIRSKGNLPGDDSKIALYEPSTNRIISFNLQTNSIIADIVWPNGNISSGGGYVSYDWSGNWVLVGMGDGSGRFYRMTPNLTNITQVHNETRHSDFAYNTAGESVHVLTKYNGSVHVINIDNPSKNYISPIFGGADPNSPSWSVTPDYISGRGQTGAPGWIAFSGESGIGSPNHPIGLYKIDGNTNAATIKVIGYDHHSALGALSNGGNDDRQKASVSPDGNQIIFTSDWGVPNGPLSAYILRGIGGGGFTCNVTCTATQTIAPSCGANNGAAKVVATGGTPPYSYLWSDGQMTTTAVSLSAGSYTVTVTDSNNQNTTCVVNLTGSGIPTCSVTVASVPSCGTNDGAATVTAQGGTPPYSYLWNDPSGQTTNTANGLAAGSYSVIVTDGNNCTTQCSITLTASSGGAFASIPTQNTVLWNAGAANSTRPKPALGVWEPGDIPGTEIMRVSDASDNGIHHYSSRQSWNADMTKIMIGDGVAADNKLLDATNNFALLPTRIPLNSNRIWSNTNPDLIYGMQGQTQFCSFNVTTGIVNVLYTRPGNSAITIRYKGNLSGDDSKIALYEPSTNKIISYDLQNNAVIAELVWPNGNINSGGNYLSYDWSGNWIVVGLGIGPNSELYRVSSDLTNIVLVSGNGEGWDLAYNAAGESVYVLTNGDGSLEVTNLDQPGQSYTSPVFGGGDPSGAFSSPDYLSGRGQTGAPGWIAFGGEGTAGSPNHPLGLYKIDDNTTTATIKVIGFDHHSNAAPTAQYGHADRQIPSVSPDGNQVLFTSDWGVPNGPLSSYVIRGIGGGAACAPINCNISLWLEGAYNSNTGNLDKNLQQLSLLPSGQPYNGPPWNYNGNEQSNYPAGSIDWVLLSLRRTDQASSEVGKGAGLLMQDGSIQNASIELTGAPASQYYIVVEHRNHLPVMTPTAVALVNNTLTYDFRLANSYAQGGFGQKAIGNQWAMYAGNIDQSSPVGYEITGADAIKWQAANGNFLIYLAEDVNLDGDVNGLDRVLLNGNNGISSAVKK